MFLVLLAACAHRTPATTPVPSETAETADTSSPPVEVAPVLFVSSYRTGRVHVFDATTGAPIGVVEGVDGAQTVVLDAAGGWVACAELKNQVVRIDPETLSVTGALVADDPETAEDETGGLKNPDAAIFGPDGRLYVSSFETDQVLRYEADGTFVDVFVAAGAGGLDGPDIGLAFAPDGRFLVPGWYSHRVHAYDPVTGAHTGDLLGPDQGLENPRQIAFDASGRMHTSAWASGGVLRTDPATGETVTLVTVPRATGMFLDEARGELLVANDGEDAVRVFDLETGADRGVRVTSTEIDGATAIGLLPR
jgi:DNA-binding beta-propeller fold protein YncE